MILVPPPSSKSSRKSSFANRSTNHPSLLPTGSTTANRGHSLDGTKREASLELTFPPKVLQRSAAIVNDRLGRTLKTVILGIMIV
jgi:hypothetical protein